MINGLILKNVAPAGIGLGKGLLLHYAEEGADAGIGILWKKIGQNIGELNREEMELYSIIEETTKKCFKNNGEEQQNSAVSTIETRAVIAEKILKSWTDNGYIDDVAYKVICEDAQNAGFSTVTKDLLNSELTTAILNNFSIRNYLWNHDLLRIRHDLSSSKEESKKTYKAIREQEELMKEQYDNLSQKIQKGKLEILGEITKPKMTNIFYLVSGIVELLFLINYHTVFSLDLDIIKSHPESISAEFSIIPLMFICLFIVNVGVKIVCLYVLNKRCSIIKVLKLKRLSQINDIIGLNRYMKINNKKTGLLRINSTWFLTMSNVLDLFVSVFALITVFTLYHEYGCSVLAKGTTSAKISLLLIIFNTILFIFKIYYGKNKKIVDNVMDNIDEW